MCCWGGKKDLGLSVAASVAIRFGWVGGGCFLFIYLFIYFPRNQKINSNQISLLAVTFKQFNLHPYVKKKDVSKIPFFHKEIRQLYFSRLIEQIWCCCAEKAAMSSYSVQRAMHCKSLWVEHKNTEIIYIIPTGLENSMMHDMHAVWSTGTDYCVLKLVYA